MSERRVLILTQHNLTVCQERHGSVFREHAFTLDEAGQAGFQDWAAANDRRLVHLLVDLPDESFQQETLPYVMGSDRKALLSRKLQQLFFGTPYSTVRSLGREKQGRRDENFLFAALTRPQALEPWLHAMHEVGIAVAGIHSPALLLPRLLDKQAAAEPRLIVLTMGDGGLRQSYFEHGQLRFSRLKPLNTGSIEEAAVNAYGEAVRIYQYLVGQRLISRGDKIPVVCLASPVHFELMRRACVDTGELSFSFTDLQTLAKARGLIIAPDESSVDALLIHMLTRQSPAQQFGDAAARLGYTRWKRRKLIRQLTLATLATAGLVLIATGISLWSDHEQRNEALLISQQARQQYNSIVQGMPTIPISPEQLRSLIAEWQQLQTNSPTLARSLQPLSTALQQNPKVELRSLNWRLSSNPDSADNTGFNEAKGSENQWLLIDIEAEMPVPVGSNRRTQSQSIDRFVESLKQGPEDHARILQRPFDTDSDKSLKGDNESHAGKGSLMFSVRYWRRSES